MSPRQYNTPSGELANCYGPMVSVARFSTLRRSWSGTRTLRRKVQRRRQWRSGCDRALERNEVAWWRISAGYVVAAVLELPMVAAAGPEEDD